MSARAGLVRAGRSSLLVVLFAAGGPSVAGAQVADPFRGSGFGPEDGIVTTRHEVVLDGRIVTYTARAGRIPIRGTRPARLGG